MSYVYFPPRVSNFFPGGTPYLAGLGLGLGYVPSAAAQYEIDFKLWSKDKKKYDDAMLVYNAKVKSINDAYGSAIMVYYKEKAAWDEAKQTYEAAMNGWSRAFASIKAANTTASQKIAKDYGISLAQSYYDGGACLSKQQHEDSKARCQTVKGLGLGSLDPECGYKWLPICDFANKPTLASPPIAPSYAPYPRKPKLRAQPKAPPVVLVKTPVPVPVPVTTPPGPTVEVTVPVPVATPVPDAAEPERAKQAGMVTNGLILIAVLGGGYLIYRTLKKPKAA
jgi:hypothetical protein